MKPLRLIELFAGYGSQAMALKRLGVPFEHWKVVEFDKYAIRSYNAVHGTNFSTIDIRDVKGEDLEINNTDEFDYLLFYSFPCTDLSLAGQQKGMSRESNTRSGLLWEVERLLKECETLPQILIMENVPQVHGKKNFDDFCEWIRFLDSLGYTSRWQDMNATEHGIPQNRNRTFMVSILDNRPFHFPMPRELNIKLKDLLEEDVDEKYFLSKKMIDFFFANEQKQKENGNGFRFGVTDGDCIAKAVTTRAGARMDDNFILIPTNNEQGFDVAEHGDSIDLSFPNSSTTSGRVGHGVSQTIPSTKIPNVVVNSGPTLLGGIGEKDSNNGTQYKLQDRVYDSNGVAACLGSSNFRPNYSIELKRGYSITVQEEQKDTTEIDVIGNYSKSDYQSTQIVGKNGVSPTVRENHGQVTAVCSSDLRIRKLTPTECFRLMGVSDEDSRKILEVVSTSQGYKQAGNSIVVDVLVDIFRNLFSPTETNEAYQIDIFEYLGGLTNE